ncbi:MAG: c-type cytochrome [Gallionella sp.]
MTKYAIPISALLFVAMVCVAHADTKSLAVEKQCFSCHTADIQVGKAPPFRAIAEKYKGKANVEANLVQKIKNGGVGHWGSIPMPAIEGERPDVSDAEARELVAWILAQH